MNTLLDKWRFYCQDLTSPNSFIDMAFYFMIGAALQRRVYVGSEERPLFPNMYVILVGDPGVGKTNVIKPIIKILEYHKLVTNRPTATPMLKTVGAGNDSVDNILSEAMRLTSSGKEKLEDLLVIPMAPQATTYEKLVNINSLSVRHKRTTERTNTLAKNGIYTHCSLCFTLEEISSLFRKHTEDLINYLITAFDCGDYSYETLSRGKDMVKRTCLSFLGGTTPQFMQTAFTNNLVGEGFSARCLFVYEEAPRFHRFDQSKHSLEQEAAKMEIIAHVKKLTELFGRVTYTKEAYNYLKEYVEDIMPHEKRQLNHKLLPYLARKALHLQKLAMCTHFSHSLDMTIGIESCIAARERLHKLEDKMHMALNVGGRNHAGSASARVLRYIRNAGEDGVTFNEIWTEFISELNKDGIGEVLEFLLDTQRVEYKIENEQRVFYVKGII